MQDKLIFNPPIPNGSGHQIAWFLPHGASMALALSNVMRTAQQPLLIVAPDSLTSSHLLDELAFFSGNHEHVVHFPDWETLPYDHFSPHQDIISERLSSLYQLPDRKKGAVITTISTLMHRLPPTHYLAGHHFSLKVGDQLNTDILRTRLAKAGYHSVSQVREHGDFAIRGSLIDLYPMGSKTPYRIDLFDDDVDSIRLFSVD